MLKKRAHMKSFILLILSAVLSTSCIRAKSEFGIVFSANLGGNQDIYQAIGPNFQPVERLTFTPNDPEQDILITKSGGWILFHVPSPGVERILSESLTGLAASPRTSLLNMKTRTTEDLGISLGTNIPLAWAKDESQIVLATPNSGKVYILGKNGEAIQELEVPHRYTGSAIESLSYSFDEAQIAYEEAYSHSFAPPAGTNSSFIYDVRTMTTIDLNKISETCRTPKWSPSAKKLLLSCDLSTNGLTADLHVRIFDFKMGESITVREVADLPKCTGPSWSPDGKKIVLMCQEGDTGLFRLFSVNSDGSDYKQINLSGPNVPSHFWEPIWTPEGRQVLYLGGDNSDSVDIYITNIDGSNNHAITAQKANYSQLSAFALP
jgi:Tol biopolymer transport system component